MQTKTATAAKTLRNLDSWAAMQADDCRAYVGIATSANRTDYERLGYAQLAMTAARNVVRYVTGGSKLKVAA